MSRKIKELMVKEYTQRFSDLGERGCVVFGYQGLDANATNEVRRIVKEHESEMFVTRNRLMVLSLNELGMPELKDFFQGPAAIVMGPDPVQAAKAISSAREQYPVIKLLGGYAEGCVLEEPEVEKLSDIPDRSVLLGQTLGLISAPAQRFVSGLSFAMTRFATAVNQLKEKKEKSGDE